ncbi:hypothetical protein REPUB_Repub02eG0119900 [Reevesia pubescens]
MDLTEGVGESSSPPRSFGSFNSYDVRNNVFNRLVETGHEEAISNPDFRDYLDSHFNRLPASYGLDVNMDRVEDVLLHQKLLASAKDPEKRPVYHIRFLENLCTKADASDDQQHINSLSAQRPFNDGDSEKVVPSDKRSREHPVDFEPCSKLEDLNLDVRKNSNCVEDICFMENSSRSQEIVHIPIHEVIFSTTDRPKLLSQLSALLSDIGLNIREAHVFSTTDGYSLDVFVVDGWPVEVIKVADFGVARFQNQGGVMTAETGTYRWMAPEVINHQPYDQKADVFSFAIVLWELVTAKVPYDTMTPLQAALGVRQGLRPDLPENAHPKLLDLMQRCWEAAFDKRPSFSEITAELDTLFEEV